jgi:hypothetical protein
LERFLTQPFFATEQFSGIKGKLVSLKDSLDGCERILRDEFKDYPESALYMIGAIDEAKDKFKLGEPAAKSGSGVKTEAKGADSKPGGKPDAKPAADPKPDGKLDAKAAADSKPDAKPDVKPAAEPKPDAKADAEPGADPQPEPQAKPTSEPEVAHAAAGAHES